MTRDWATDPPATAEELGEALADKCIELVAAERRATVERIRERLVGESSPVDALYDRHTRAILDEEAAR